MLVLLMAFAVKALAADYEVFIDNFSINPGQRQTVSVMMNNAGPVSSLQFEVEMPEGLSIVGSPTLNPDRISSNAHTISKTTVNGKSRFVILERTGVDPANSAILGNEGALFSFQVSAASTFKSGTIRISEVYGSNNTDPLLENKEIVMPSTETEVLAHVGSFSLNPEAVVLKEGETGTIDFVLTNDVSLNGLQADILIPEGLELVANEQGGLFNYSDRLSLNVEIGSNPIAGGYRIMLASLSGDAFAGTDGTLFSFSVKANEVAENLTVTVENVRVSTTAISASYALSGFAVTTVTVESAEEPEVEGDLTGDGEVSVADIQAVINAWKDVSADTKFDVNGDGEINVADIQYLINLMKK